MALTDSEIARVRYELGYPNLAQTAEPYIGITPLFSAVIQPYTLSGASTTSSTPVTAATSPTQQTLVLASATGVAQGNIVVIDVDSRQERATVQNISGNSITVLLSLEHGGTYPVTVEGGESIIRDILNQLRLISDGMNGSKGALQQMQSRLGIKEIIGDVSFFGGGNTLASQGVDPLTQLLKLREYWRDELAAALNLERRNGPGHGGGANISVY